MSATDSDIYVANVNICGYSKLLKSGKFQFNLMSTPKRKKQTVLFFNTVSKLDFLNYLDFFSW